MRSEQQQAAWDAVGEYRERRELVSQYALGDPVLGLGFDQLDAMDWSATKAVPGPDDGARVSAEAVNALGSAIAAWFVRAARNCLRPPSLQAAAQHPSLAMIPAVGGSTPSEPVGSM